MKIRKIDQGCVKDSIVDIELNRILEKISEKSLLTKRENDFLDSYKHIDNDELKDLSYLSKEAVYNKVKKLLEKDNTIICNLYDRNGKISCKIKEIENDKPESCKLILKNNEIFNLQDKFLYDITYDIRKNEYSLESNNEYYEKIHVN